MNLAERQAVAAGYFALVNSVNMADADVKKYVAIRERTFANYPKRIESLREQIAKLEAAIENGGKDRTAAEKTARKRLSKAQEKVDALVRTNPWLAKLAIPTLDDVFAQLDDADAGDNADAGDDADAGDAN